MKSILRIMRTYVSRHKKLALLSVLVTILVAGVSLLAPWPLKILIDHALGDHPLPQPLAGFDWLVGNRTSILIFAVILGLLIVLLDNALTVYQSYVTTKFEQQLILEMRSDLFQHTHRLSLAFHDSSRLGSLIYVVNSQAHAAAGVIMSILPMAQSAITLVGMVWIALIIDAGLALLALSVVPFLYYSVGFYAKRIQPQLMHVKTLEGESLSIVHEAFAMLRVIVAFGREPYEFRRFRKQAEHAVDARIKVTVKQTLFSLVVNMTTAVGTALVLGFGAFRALEGHITIGELLIVLGYIAAIYTPLETISTTIGQLQDQFVSLRMAFGLLDTEPEIRDAPDAISIGRAQGNITFEHVSFSYKTRVDTLKDISFEARAGEVIAIVGPTGAGKTTLISLLPRFYDIKAGRILLDGHDIKKLTLKSLRDQISLVMQEPLLFSGTIADNIRYGRLDASMEEVMEAAKSANSHDFIMKLPKKYDTLIGERGSQLSGGERQRISVARAFLKDAPILILDEPTSSIDSRTEAVILDALDRLMVGRTTLMIAHRLSTIRHADQILVINHGELVEKGSHEELLEKDGLYKQLHGMQVGQVRRRPSLLASAATNPAPSATVETPSARATSDARANGNSDSDTGELISSTPGGAQAESARPLDDQAPTGDTLLPVEDSIPASHNGSADEHSNERSIADVLASSSGAVGAVGAVGVEDHTYLGNGNGHTNGNHKTHNDEVDHPAGSEGKVVSAKSHLGELYATVLPAKPEPTTTESSLPGLLPGSIKTLAQPTPDNLGTLDTLVKLPLAPTSKPPTQAITTSAPAPPTEQVPQPPMPPSASGQLAPNAAPASAPTKESTSTHTPTPRTLVREDGVEPQALAQISPLHIIVAVVGGLALWWFRFRRRGM